MYAHYTSQKLVLSRYLLIVTFLSTASGCAIVGGYTMCPLDVCTTITNITTPGVGVDGGVSDVADPDVWPNTIALILLGTPVAHNVARGSVDTRDVNVSLTHV